MTKKVGGQKEARDFVGIIEGRSKLMKFPQELFLEALDGIIFCDERGVIITANEAACGIFEYKLSDLLGKNIKELWSAINRDYFKELALQLKQTGAIKSQVLLPLQNGKEKYLEFTCKVHENERIILTICRDITERYRMEKNLRENERKFRRVFEGSIDGLFLWDNLLQIVDINSVAIEMFNLSKEKLIGKSILQILSKVPGIEKEIQEHISQVFEHGKHSSALSFQLNDGTKRYFEYSTKCEIVEGLNLTIFKDVTEKAVMEEQLRKSETLNVIGELAAGIAHEIRNPMTALKGFIQLLEGSIKKEHAMYYQVITTELQRIDSIINEFLLLAKPQAIRYQEFNINQIMRETIELLNAQAVLHNVQILTVYDELIPPIYCEPNQLKKVFVNLIKNAIEVMPEGGTISVSIGRKENNKVLISIQDEGMGISEEKIKRLGEPFYTTKERGTGLGLMVSYKIIEEHKGVIQIESIEGKGTTFHLVLPLDLNNIKEQ